MPLTDKNGYTENRYFLLYELFQEISASLDPQKSLNSIIDAAVKITDATSGSLVMVDWENNILEIKVSRGFVKHIGDVRLRVGEGVTGWVALSGEPILVSDVTNEPRYIPVKEDIQTELAVPMKLEHELIGVLNVDSTRKHAFTQEDVALLTLLANQSAQVIHNGNLFDTVNRQVKELSTLIEINKMIASSLSVEKILNQIVERTAELMHSNICSIMLVSEDGKSLELKAYYGGDFNLQRKSIPISGTLYGKVLRDKKSRRIKNLRDVKHEKLEEITDNEGIHALLTVPLVARDVAIGLLNIYKSYSYEFSDEEKRLLRTFADLCAVAIDNAHLHEQTVLLEDQARRAGRVAAVGELAVGIAHEIRNPLTIIKMIFEAGETLNEEDRHVISTELQRMNKIITQLLDYTRLKEPEREWCQLGKILENSFLLLNYDLSKKNIQLTKCVPDKLPLVWADPVQLQQIFLNILLNASDAVPEGGKIKVQCGTTDDKFIEVKIHDNGSGLPDAVKKNLFVPFTSTKEKGLGLGLSIVKSLIEAHLGSVHIESTPGVGTIVTVRLPETH
ncbi:MAG: GAF domain-containing protein [Deferribacteres bacterium]|nr:GAF domain-containing protein [candidate division KSB1 bacterium]MCB9502530.1 GAF domain-containing protein [Deferribacteres bacterium]